MFLENVLSKFKDQQELTPEQRAEYFDKLEYINSKSEEIHKLFKESQRVEQSLSLVDRQCRQLEAHVSETNMTYEELTKSMERLSKSISEIPNISDGVKQACFPLSIACVVCSLSSECCKHRSMKQTRLHHA